MANRKCWFWWGKTKLLMVSKLFIVSKKKVLKAWVGTSLSPHPPTFWLTGEIKRYLHSLLYKQVLIVIITLGNSMWPMILMTKIQSSEVWLLFGTQKGKGMICFHSRCGDWRRNFGCQQENLSHTGAHVTSQVGINWNLYI